MIKQPEHWPEASTIVDIIRWRAVHQAQNKAYTYLEKGESEKASISYHKLDQRARSIAAQLMLEGTRIGDRALLLYPTGLEYICAFLGCLYAGVIAVPAYPPHRTRHLERFKAILSDAEPKVILTEHSIVDNLQNIPSLAGHPASPKWMLTDRFDSNPAEQWQPPPLSPTTPAFLQYTSGSTAEPKGVIVQHGNLIYNQAMIKQGMAHSQNSTFVSWLPLFHDMGLIGNMLQPLYIGSHCIFMSPADFLQKPLRWLAAISRYQAHTSGAPNFAYELCADKITDEQRQTLDLSSWRIAYNGSEPVQAGTLQRFYETFAACGFREEAFYPCFGLAEATLFVSGGWKDCRPTRLTLEGKALEQNQVVAAAVDDPFSRTLVGCGQSWLQQKILIVDPDRLKSLAAGQVGEIWVTGPNISTGYWHQPEESEQILNAGLQESGEEPFLRTGDLGFIDSGELYVTGRIKDMMVIRGNNYYPQDVELIASQSHRALGVGAAFSIEVEREERLVMVFEVQRAFFRRPDYEEIFDAMTSAVSTALELQVFQIALIKYASMPKTSSGKIQRHRCRQGFLNKTLKLIAEWEQPVFDRQDLTDNCANSADTETGAPWTTSAIKAWLISRISTGLQLEAGALDLQQSFAQYGLDSSVIMMLTGELSDLLGRNLEPIVFWEYPTIEKLARHLTENQ